MSDNLRLDQLARQLAPYLAAWLAGQPGTPQSGTMVVPESASTPATPAAGYGVLFVSSTGVPSGVDDAGVVRTMARPVGGARVYNSANISIANATFTDLTFDSERFDDSAFHSTVTNTGRLTIPVTGTYVIAAAVRFASNTTGARQTRILLNGTTMIVRDLRSASTGLVYVSMTTIYHLTAGDYLTLNVYQDSGGALNVEVEGNWSPEFSISYVGT
jgi:hypothetical protein